MLARNVTGEIVERETRAIPRIVVGALRQHAATERLRYIDFGCDLGLKTLGYAASGGFGHVTGVDLHDNFRNLDTVLEHFSVTRPPNLDFAVVSPAAPLTALGQFDGMVSWSVFEHVRSDIFESVLGEVFEALAPGSVSFVQVNPLFHSQMGAHLWGLFGPWEHLRPDAEVLALIDARAESPQRAQAARSLYGTLNRFRLDDFRAAFRSAGFETLEERIGRTAAEPPDRLLDRFDRDDLTIEGFQMILRKPAAADSAPA